MNIGQKNSIEVLRGVVKLISVTCNLLDPEPRSELVQARHSLVRLGRLGLGSKAVCRSIFNDFSKNGECQKFQTCTLIDSSLID